MGTTEVNERQYARFAVCLNARFRCFDSAEEAEGIEETLLAAPSVWAPPGESELWKLADSQQSGASGLLAKAVLDISAQIERLNRSVLDPDGPMQVGEIHEISCGGARFSSQQLLKPGSLMLLSPMDDENEAPPVRILAEVIHLEGGPAGQHGIVFKAMHPTDKKRLTRYIYGLQRRQLRRASELRP